MSDSPVISVIFWGVLILCCFYLGAKLTFQIRERKKSTLKLDFDEAKKREKKI